MESEFKTVVQLPLVSVSNSYPASPEETLFMRRLQLQVSCQTGLLSFQNPFQAHHLRHAFEWLEYQEPNAHCAATAHYLVSRLGLDRGCTVGGLSWKDVDLLTHLAENGAKTNLVFPRVWESEQPVRSDRWRRDSSDVQQAVSRLSVHTPVPQFDLLVVRHILEHTTSIKLFLSGLREMLKPNGVVVFEVPDCQTALDQLDYSLIWDEHNHYFTDSSLELSMRKLGWQVHELLRFESNKEPILLALAQPTSVDFCRPLDARLQSELQRADRFGEQFPVVRAQVGDRLYKERLLRSQMFIFGANHTASNFLDLFADREMFDGCLDNSPHKENRFISRWKLPIRNPSNSLIHRDALIINAIHPGRAEEAERRLRQKVGGSIDIVLLRDFTR